MSTALIVDSVRTTNWLEAQFGPDRTRWPWSAFIWWIDRFLDTQDLLAELAP